MAHLGVVERASERSVACSRPFQPFFPLRGPHRLDGSSCHTTPGNFSTFGFITSHEHRNSKHGDD